MNRSRTILLAVAMLAIAAISSPAVSQQNIDLGTWTQEGVTAGPNWQLAADRLSVNQTVNTPVPTFYVSSTTFIDTTIRGRFGVQTTSDDDFIGFAFGYAAPLLSNADNPRTNSFILFDWKQAAQSSAAVGFRLAKVSGTHNNASHESNQFWGHSSTSGMTFTRLANPAVNVGWADNTLYDFELTYRRDRITIRLRGGTGALSNWTTVYDVLASSLPNGLFPDNQFPNGRFAFYNLSQERVRYEGFTQEGDPILFVSPGNGQPLNFSPTRYGTTSSANVEVRNVGGIGSNLVGEISAASPPFAGPLPNPEFSLSLEDSVFKQFQFAPQARGSASQSLAVISNGGSSAFNLVGLGVGPVFSSLPSAGSVISFGTVEATSSGSNILFVTNATNDAPVSLDLVGLGLLDIRFEGPDADLFELVGRPRPYTLAKGESELLGITLTPAGRTGPLSARMWMTTDVGQPLGTPGAEYFVDLTATGILRPDLTVPAVDAPSLATLGESITIRWTVNNQGGGAATGSWVDRVVLSRDDVFGGSDDRVLGNVTRQGPVGPSGQYVGQLTVTLPLDATLTSGAYSIFVRTNATGSLQEVSTNNNTSAPRGINLAHPSLPDLFTEDIVGFADSPAGSDVTLSWTTRNIGSAAATGSWVDKVYLSTNQTWEASDPQLGTVSGYLRSGPLAPNEVYQTLAQVALPYITPGEYYLIVRTDANNQVEEFLGEANNTTVSTTRVRILPPPLPDLVVSNITPPSNANPGSIAEIAYTVTNIGSGPALGSWDESLYGSLDDQIGGDLPGPTTRFSGPLLPGQSVQRRYNVTVPNVPPGNYWLVVCIDTRSGGEIEESNETNNCAITPVCYNCNTPNLTVASVIPPATGVAGSQVSVSWTVTNTGLGETTASWMDRVVLSPACGGPGTITLAEFRRSTVLLAGGSYTLARNVTLPPELEGDYFFSVITDAYNELPEPGGEGDNTTCAATPTAISLIDAPDLIVANVEPMASTGTFDRPFTLRWTVRNIGSLPAALPWNDRVFLSANALRDGDDFPLEPLRPATVSLDPTGEYTVEHTVQLPLRSFLPPGNYHFIVVTDVGNSVSEQRETNQFAVSPAVFIERPPLPDLRVVSISTPIAACPGQQVEVVYTVVNSGNAPAEGTWIERVLASPDDQIGNDYFGSQQTVSGPIAPGEMVTRQGTLTVPNEGLSYRVVVCVDVQNTVFESDESNNCELSFIRPTIARPDLQVASINASPTAVLADDTLRVTWGIINAGPCATPATFIDTVFLESLDGQQSHLLGSGIHAGTVQPGQTSIRDHLFYIPGRIQGEFRVKVRADSASNILESNEDNNTAVSEMVITVGQPPRPDLVVLPGSVIVPEDGLVSSSGTVEYILANLGDGDAQGPWADRIVARLVGEQPGPDIEIGSLNYAGVIPSGEFITRTATIQLPAQAGAYTICIITDSGDTVNEGLAGGESNNRACSIDAFLADGYRVVVTPDLQEGQAGTPVRVSGYAEVLSTGQRVGPGVPVRIRHSVRGFARTLSLNTNEDGAFGVPTGELLTLLPTEAGRYIISAGPPGAIAPTTPEVSFVLHGLRSTPEFTNLRVAPGVLTAAGTLELFNAGDVTLTNLQVVAEDAPPGLVIDLRLSGQPLGGQAIVGQQVIRPTFTLSAPQGTESFTGVITLRWSTAQGAGATTRLHVRVAPREPQITATPGTLAAGMLTSTPDAPTQTAVQFTIKNTGGLPTGPVRVELPANTPWMTLATPQILPSLEADEEAQVVLTLAPTQAQQLGEYTGQLVLRYDNNTRTCAVPYRFNHRSDALGSIEVAAANEETYWAPTRPPLAGTLVVVKDARTNQVMGTQTTGTSGRVQFDDLPEGAYYVEASTSNHGDFRALASVNRDRVSTTEAFLPRQTVTYSWRVDPIQIQDRYRFVLDATFVTNVYKPVLDVTIIDSQTGETSRVIDLDTVESQKLFYVRIVNRGLIAAPNVQIQTSSTPSWQTEVLTSQIGVIQPGESNAITVPLLVRNLSRSGPGCQMPTMRTCFELPCGDSTYTTCDLTPYRWVNVCTGPGGYVPPGGSGGSGGSGSGGRPFSNTPTFQCNTACSCESLGYYEGEEIRCVGETIVLSAPCATELRWEVSGPNQPAPSANQCVPGLTLPLNNPGYHYISAYCKCPNGEALVARYEVLAVRVTIADATGRVISGEITDTVIGQKHSLRVSIEPSGIETQRITWTVDGPAITSYAEPPLFSGEPPVPLTDFEGESITPFAWYDGSQSRGVGVSVEVQGISCSAFAGYRVFEPEVYQFTGDQSTHTAGAGRLPFPFLFDVRYGDLAALIPGIQFTASVDTLGYGGTIDLFQIIDLTSRYVHEGGIAGIPDCWRRYDLEGPVADGAIPYGGFDDSPGQGGRQGATTIVMQDYFTTTLMWRPEGGIWVPLSRLQWYHSVRAEFDIYDPENPQIVHSAPPSGTRVVGSRAVGVFPLWNYIHSNNIEDPPCEP